MNPPRYVMQDQARGTVQDIMRRDIDRESARRGPLVAQPSWLALVLLVAAFNLIAIAAP